MVAAQVFAMPLYEPKSAKEPMGPLPARVPQSLIEALDAVVKLWQYYAVARGDEARAIDRSYVVRRMLRSGVEIAFADFPELEELPKTDEEWAKLQERIEKQVKVEKSKRR